MVNCIDVSCRPVQDTVRLIREWSQPDVYKERSKIIAKTFQQDVSFADEAKKIEDWIATLPKGV